MIYLAGPLTHDDMDTRTLFLHRAEAAYLECVYAGVPAFCPHLSGRIPGIFDPTHPVTYEHWIRACLNMLPLCSALWLLPGWQQSRGATLEAAAWPSEKSNAVYFTFDQVVLAHPGRFLATGLPCPQNSPTMIRRGQFFTDAWYL